MTMKRKILLALALALSLICAKAQTEKIYICLSNGEIATHLLEDIDSVVFHNPKACCPDNNHPHMLDLGLPSGTKWACCNVGASSPEEYGTYFHWGLTEQTDKNTWYDGSQSFRGDKDHDAATANWGDHWATPSDAEAQELFDNTDWEWTTENGVKGVKYISKVEGHTNVYVFMPAAGRCRADGVSESEGKYGYCWTSSPDASNAQKAQCIHFYEWAADYLSKQHRSYGQPVRPVSK